MNLQERKKIYAEMVAQSRPGRKGKSIVGDVAEKYGYTKIMVAHYFNREIKRIRRHHVEMFEYAKKRVNNEEGD